VEPRVEVDLAVGEITDALDTLAALTEPVNRFFDAVLVMTDDPPLRRARLALLARADRLYLKLADFSKLVLE
jgi:glycyl-tRNA synthetase beta chain